MRKTIDNRTALKSLNELGIVPVDVQGGRMWLNQQNGQHFWKASQALASLDLTELDNEQTYNHAATIQIKKNTYEVPKQAREEAVQAICDAFLNRCCWSIFHPTTISPYRTATLHVAGHRNGEWYGFREQPSDSEKSIRIRGVEMKQAFAELRKAGYHIFRILEYGCWPGYQISEKPYLKGGTEVTEFTDFID